MLQQEVQDKKMRKPDSDVRRPAGTLATRYASYRRAPCS
jgi:hypothetical protein